MFNHENPYRLESGLRLQVSQVCKRVHERGCCCNCNIFSTKIRPLLAKWGHFVWSSQLQRTRWGLRPGFNVEVGFGSGGSLRCWIRGWIIPLLLCRWHPAVSKQLPPSHHFFFYFSFLPLLLSICLLEITLRFFSFLGLCTVWCPWLLLKAPTNKCIVVLNTLYQQKSSQR